eukprot:1155523-Pelagomonas_calceolata.AAC.1
MFITTMKLSRSSSIRAILKGHRIGFNLKSYDRVSTGPCPGNSKTISQSVIQFPGLSGKEFP